MRLLSTLIALALLAACGAMEQAPGVAGAKGDNPQCIADPSPGTLCSVDEAACQQRIWRALACVHPELSGPAPIIDFVDDPAAEAQAQGGEDYKSPADLVLETLGVPTREATAAGYYDGQRVVLDDDAASGSEDAALWWVFALAHEMVHVVQGQNDRLTYDYTSSLLMTSTMIEGEAQLYGLLTLRAMGFDVQIEETIAAGDAQQAALVTQDFGRATATFPYNVGQRLMFAAYQRAGWTGVEDLYFNPPTSYRALHGEGRPWSATPVSCAPAAESRDVLEVNLEAWHVVGLLQAAGSDNPLGITRAWRGGQAFLRTTRAATDGALVNTARWRLRWSDPWTAGQVASLIAQSLAGDRRRTVETDGADVIVSGTTGEPAWTPDPLPLRCQ